MIKLPTREDFERYCKENKDRNPWHPEYYSHLTAREKWDAWQAAIAEVQRLNAAAQPVSDGWVKCSDRLPPDETAVLINFNGEPRIGELRWDHPTHEESYKSFRYWDCPYNDGQPWEVFDITHWMPLPAAPGGQDD